MSDTKLGGRFAFPGTSLTVHRMGYGAMQLAGPGVFGPPEDPDEAVAVLREAIAAGGSSISDYVDADGRRGFFQVSHRVYQRTGEPCVNCGTPIRRTLVAQRSSHFCPRCQKR